MYAQNALKTPCFQSFFHSFQLLRWTFNAPTDEHVEQLKIQMATVCKPALHVQLYHSDFKQYLKALETLTQVRARSLIAVDRKGSKRFCFRF